MTKICILAGNYKEALTYAIGQNFPKETWFYPKDEFELLTKSNFHVLVVGTAGENVPPSYFEKIYQTAQNRGKIGRF